MDFDYQPSHQQYKPLYPVAAYEITLLEQARQVAKRREEAYFRRLTHTYQWAITQRQKAFYIASMQFGFTLILTDVSNTILWTSCNFLSLTGYNSQEALGKTPKMLQGPGTDPLITRHIGNSIRQAQAVKVDLVNYRKGGQAYSCHLEIDPLRTRQGKLTHFLAKTSEVIV